MKLLETKQFDKDDTIYYLACKCMFVVTEKISGFRFLWHPACGGSKVAHLSFCQGLLKRKLVFAPEYGSFHGRIIPSQP